MNSTPLVKQYGILLTSGVLLNVKGNTEQEIHGGIKARKCRNDAGGKAELSLLPDVDGLPRSTYCYYAKTQKEPDKYAELIDSLDYYNDRRIKLKRKGLTPAQHRYQTLQVT